MREATKVVAVAPCRLSSAHPHTEKRTGQRRERSSPLARPVQLLLTRSALEDDQVLRLRPESIGILDLQVATEPGAVARRASRVVEALPGDDRVGTCRVGNLDLVHGALVD